MLRMSPEAMNELFQPTISHIIQHIGGTHPAMGNSCPCPTPSPWDHFHLWDIPTLFLGAPSSLEFFLSLGPPLSL